MPVERFNDMASGDGPVSQTGTQGTGATPASPAKAVGRPKAVETSDGTDSPRADLTVKSAALPSSPAGGSAKFKPGAVRSYSDSGV